MIFIIQHFTVCDLINCLQYTLDYQIKFLPLINKRDINLNSEQTTVYVNFIKIVHEIA